MNARFYITVNIHADLKRYMPYVLGHRKSHNLDDFGECVLETCAKSARSLM